MKTCPKCQVDQQSDTICDACGVVFAKYYKYHPPIDEQDGEEADDLVTIYDEHEAPIRPAWLATHPDHSTTPSLLRFSLLAFLLVASLIMLSGGTSPDDAISRFLHLVATPFHEAGHVFMSPFGSFIASLGGTLGQLAMPLVCCLVLLLRTGDPFGASIAAWWFGQNFIDIAPYIADARAGQLPLLGGNVGHASPYGFHDWEYLLTETGLIQHDSTIAGLSIFIGGLLMLASLGWGSLAAFTILQQTRALSDR